MLEKEIQKIESEICFSSWEAKDWDELSKMKEEISDHTDALYNNYNPE